MASTSALRRPCGEGAGDRGSPCPAAAAGQGHAGCPHRANTPRRGAAAPAPLCPPSPGPQKGSRHGRGSPCPNPAAGAALPRSKRAHSAQLPGNANHTEIYLHGFALRDSPGLELGFVLPLGMSPGPADAGHTGHAHETPAQPSRCTRKVTAQTYLSCALKQPLY